MDWRNPGDVPERLKFHILHMAAFGFYLRQQPFVLCGGLISSLVQLGRAIAFAMLRDMQIDAPPRHAMENAGVELDCAFDDGMTYIAKLPQEACHNHYDERLFFQRHNLSNVVLQARPFLKLYVLSVSPPLVCAKSHPSDFVHSGERQSLA